LEGERAGSGVLLDVGDLVSELELDSLLFKDSLELLAAKKESGR